MREQKFKRQVEEIECPNCGGFGAVHSIFRLNRTTVRHAIHCKWCDIVTGGMRKGMKLNRKSPL